MRHFSANRERRTADAALTLRAGGPGSDTLEAPAEAPAPRREGGASVELAVVAPFLVLIFVITVDFSRVFYHQLTINQCARNAALYGSNLRSYQETSWAAPYSTASPPSDDNIKAVAVTDGANLNPPLTTSQVQVTHNSGSDGNAAVQVTVTYTFTSITGISTPITLQARSSMRVAQ